MPTVVGVSLRVAGRIYHFATNDADYKRGDRVVVDTVRGHDIGTVRVPTYELHSIPTDELRPVLRLADARDMARQSHQREREPKAITEVRTVVAEHKLPMRVAAVHYSLDGKFATVLFSSEDRVDFRAAVRDLSRVLGARVDLRQVGARDEAKLCGGCGGCGQPLCCSTFLRGFAPVSITMAKVQGLALQPQKISGLCGRLMCCLAYENDYYRSLRESLPRLNARVATPRGPGKVTKVNVLASTVEVVLPDVNGFHWFPLDEVTVQPRAADGSIPAAPPESRPARPVAPPRPSPAASAPEPADRPARRQLRPVPPTPRPVPPPAAPPPPVPPAVVPAPSSASAPGEGSPRRRRRRGGSQPVGASATAPSAPSAGSSAGSPGGDAPAPHASRRRRRRRGGSAPAAE